MKWTWSPKEPDCPHITGPQHRWFNLHTMETDDRYLSVDRCDHCDVRRVMDEPRGSAKFKRYRRFGQPIATKKGSE